MTKEARLFIAGVLLTFTVLLGAMVAAVLGMAP